MRRLIDQLLVFTQGIAGTMSLDRTPTTFGAITSTTLNEVATGGRAVNVRTETDPPLSADPSRLSQLIDNLVANALKHGKGDVTVRIQRDGDQAMLSVHNMGSPIPPDAIPTLFEPYRRATPRAGGFGLGLFIVDRIARAHGGNVSVTSSETDGTTFTVRLPVATP
jgi:signal transduction histidine kinase